MKTADQVTICRIPQIPIFTGIQEGVAEAILKGFKLKKVSHIVRADAVAHYEAVAAGGDRVTDEQLQALYRLHMCQCLMCGGGLQSVGAGTSTYLCARCYVETVYG